MPTLLLALSLIGQIGQPPADGREPARFAPSDESNWLAPTQRQDPQQQTQTIRTSAQHDASRVLPPPDRAKRSAGASTESRPSGGSSAGRVVTALGSLAVVVGLFFLLAWVLRRAGPGASGRLPSGVIEVLGRTTIAPRQFVDLIRVGNKLLVVSVTPAGAETLTEITDPEEVDRLAGLALAEQPGSATVSFRQMFQQLSGKAA